MRVFEGEKKDNHSQLNSLTGLMGVLGYAIGIIMAPIILNKVIKLGSEEFSFDYYKIVADLINKNA